MGKLKKLLAMGLIGVVGAASLTGCSLTSDQQASLDMLVSKTEELTQVIEKQNKVLSTAEAVKMTNIAIKTEFLLDDGLTYIKADGKYYDGQFVKETLSGCTEFYYCRENNKELLIMAQDNTLASFKDYDYSGNTLKAYESSEYFAIYPNGTATKITDPVKGEILCDATMLKQFVPITEVEEDDIYDIEATSDGYKFKYLIKKTFTETEMGTFSGVDSDKSTISYLVTFEIANNRILNVESKEIITKKNSQNHLVEETSMCVTLTYDYNSTKDISSYKQRIKALEDAVDAED